MRIYQRYIFNKKMQRNLLRNQEETEMKKTNLRKIISAATAISIVSGMLAFNAMAESSLTADVYADLNGVVLDFSEDVSVADLTKIKLYNGDTEITVEPSVESDGDVILGAALEKNVVYTVNIPEGFTENSPVIEKKFVVKEVFSENFDETANGKLPATIVATAGTDYSVQEKEMQHINGAFYLDYTGTNYTVSYDMKAYQTSTGTTATAENKYAGDTAPQFMRLIYNAPDKTKGFTSQPCYTMTLRNHEASRADWMRISRGGTAWDSANSKYAFNDGNYGQEGQAYVDYNYPPAYGVTSNAAIPLDVITAQEDAEAPQAEVIKMTSRKIGNDIDLYIDGRHAVNYTGAARTEAGEIVTEGYFGVQEGYGKKAATVYDNISITACFEPQETKVTNIYADAQGVYLTFDREVSGVDSFEGISLTSSSGDVTFDASVSGNVLTIGAELETDKLYSVSLNDEFGAGAVTLGEEYSKKFKVKEITLAAEDFSGATVTDNTVTVANNGVMTLLKGNDKENYSLSFKLNVTDGGNPYLRMWYNAATTGTFHSTSNKAYVVRFWKNKTTLRPCANKQFIDDNDISISHTESYSDGSVIKLKKNGRNSDIYLNGTQIAAYAPSETYTISGADYSFGTTGYFGIWNCSSEANGYTGSWPVTLSDVTMTYFAEYDPKPMTVEGYYADKEGVVIDFSGDISDIDENTVNSAELSSNGDKVAVAGYMTEGDKLILDAAEELELNTVYDIELPAGFGTESLILEDKYIAQFKLKEEFVEDFADTAYNGGIKFSSTKDKIYNGELYLYDSTVYVKNTNNYKAYTLDFDLKSYQVVTGTNDDGTLKYEAHAPYAFRPFFTKEDAFFTACEGYVWEIENKPTEEKTIIQRGGSNQNDDGTWSGYSNGKYNVNGVSDSYAAALPEGTLSTTHANITVPYAVATETTGTTEITVRKNKNLANLYIDGGYASSLNLSDWENSYFGIQDGAGQAAYIIDNMRLTICEPVTSTVRTLKVTVKDAEGKAIDSLSGISYAKGEVLVKNYRDIVMPAVCVIAAYDENNKLLAAKVLKKNNIAAKTQESFTYEFNNISGVTEISAFCWDSFDTIVPYCNAVTIE